VVEHFHGKEGVRGSSPRVSSITCERSEGVTSQRGEEIHYNYKAKGNNMAKKKGKVQHAVMECSVCHNRNYKTQRNVVNVTSKLVLRKYCSTCQTHVEHKETK
jgi:large subunit ribosomal protein L33